MKIAQLRLSIDRMYQYLDIIHKSIEAETISSKSILYDELSQAEFLLHDIKDMVQGNFSKDDEGFYDDVIETLSIDELYDEENIF